MEGVCGYAKRRKVSVGVEMEVIAGVATQRDSSVILIGVDGVYRCV